MEINMPVLLLQKWAGKWYDQDAIHTMHRSGLKQSLYYVCQDIDHYDIDNCAGFEHFMDIWQ